MTEIDFMALRPGDVIAHAEYNGDLYRVVGVHDRYHYLPMICLRNGDICHYHNWRKMTLQSSADHQVPEGL